MGFQLPNGSSLQIHKTLATSPLAFTAMSAAKDAVLTVTGNTGNNAIQKGDVVYFTETTSPNLLYYPAIVKAATDTSVTILDLDTTDATLYPTGITGKISKVIDWVDLPLTSTIANSGGDANTTTVQFIQDDKARNLFTTTNPEITTLTMAHDSTDAARPSLQEHTRKQDFVVYRVFNPRAANGVGEWRLYTVQIQFNGNPVMAINEVETVSVAMTIQKGPNIYLKSIVDAL
ncbi:TPA: hypothetical protein JHK28_000142 [Enterobacter cloacae]|nr:hypothetical protein [Enterobacter cloacae]